VTMIRYAVQRGLNRYADRSDSTAQGMTVGPPTNTHSVTDSRSAIDDTVTTTALGLTALSSCTPEPAHLRQAAQPTTSSSPSTKPKSPRL
jgi:hypothetical protein